MNFALVSRLLSVVMLILAVAFSVCLTVSYLADGENDSKITVEAFVAAIATSIVSGALLYWVGRRASRKFYKREALCVVGLGWLLASLLGAIPYLIIVPEIGSSGAIFESASGLTTTGASVLSNLESLPPSLLFWRSLSQWIGGMGVVVFFVAILGFLGASAKMLYANEASGSLEEFAESRVQTTVLRLVCVYGGISAACFAALKLAGMGWFDAICHMFATVSTGGFSTRSESIAAFDSPLIEWVTIFFMILCGVSFLLILRAMYRNIRYVKRNTEFVVYIGLIAVISLLIAFDLRFEEKGYDLEQSVRAATFQVVSLMTTTGFATEDFALWSSLPKSFLLAAMVIGGCSGSTSGGIKVVRLVVAFKVCIMSIERSFRRRVIRPIRLNERTLSEQSTQDVMVYLVLATAIVFVSLELISLIDPGHLLDTNFSSVLACFFNIGPGLDEVGPTETYAFYMPPTKLLLSLLMIMGRLELYAVLALFAPSMWKRFH